MAGTVWRGNTTKGVCFGTGRTPFFWECTSRRTTIAVYAFFFWPSASVLLEPNTALGSLLMGTRALFGCAMDSQGLLWVDDVWALADSPFILDWWFADGCCRLFCVFVADLAMDIHLNLCAKAAWEGHSTTTL